MKDSHMETTTYPSNMDGVNAGNAVLRGVETASSALHSGIDKVAEPARNAVDSASAGAHDAVNKIASRASSTASRFTEQTRRFTEAPGHAVEYTKSWVQDKPLEALGAALALGFILGRITAR